MRKYYFMAILFCLCLCLSSCINFSPNKTNNAEGEVVEETMTVDASQDDAAIDSNTHLKFKGIPIDGTLKEFVSRMKRKGGFESIGFNCVKLAFIQNRMTFPLLI